MPSSMTGFGRAAADGPTLRVEVEARSVNHKFLKLNLKLPPVTDDLEAEIEASAKKRVARGSLDISVRLERKSETATYELDRGALRHHLATLKSVARELKLPGAPDLHLAAQLPGVFRPVERASLDSRDSNRILSTVEKALDGLQRSRKAEGKRLGTELESRWRLISTLLDAVAERAPRVLEAHHRKLGERVQRLLQGVQITIKPEDLAREVAIMADRCDITEEIARLRSHGMELLASLRKPAGEIGRQLDFLAQEMFREANTMGSKSLDAESSRTVVTIKVEIEKLREQVQNIE